MVHDYCCVCGKEIVEEGRTDVCKSCWSKPEVALSLNQATADGYLQDAIKYDDYSTLQQHYDMLEWCKYFEQAILNGTVQKYWIDATRCWNLW